MAIANFEKALKIAPNDVIIYLNEAETYEKAGNNDGAIAAYRQFISSAPPAAAKYIELAKQRIARLSNN